MEHEKLQKYQGRNRAVNPKMGAWETKLKELAKYSLQIAVEGCGYLNGHNVIYWLRYS